MDYIPANGRMNYDDAFSGAQSNALRRICGKRLGVGSQVWKKDYCNAWKQRKVNAPRGPNPPIQGAPQQRAKPPAANPPSEIGNPHRGIVEKLTDTKRKTKTGSAIYNVTIGGVDFGMFVGDNPEESARLDSIKGYGKSRCDVLVGWTKKDRWYTLTDIDAAPPREPGQDDEPPMFSDEDIQRQAEEVFG